MILTRKYLSWIFKSFDDAATTAEGTSAHKIAIFYSDSLGDSWTTSESLDNHWHRSFSTAGDSLEILKNDLKIHVFLAAVESSVASRFKDPARINLLTFLTIINIV